jgi:rhodanese-related sulfurtransferase
VGDGTGLELRLSNRVKAQRKYSGEFEPGDTGLPSADAQNVSEAGNLAGREAQMLVVLVIVVLTALAGLGLFGWKKRKNTERELERHSVSPAELHALLGSGEQVLIFDVRQALDLLAYPEQIPGAQRIPPEEVLDKPNLIPKDKDVVVYCTCPSEKTSRRVLRRALALGFSRVKFLSGGLAAWKGLGFPVEPFRGTLTFSSAAGAPPSA